MWISFWLGLHWVQSKRQGSHVGGLESNAQDLHVGINTEKKNSLILKIYRTRDFMFNFRHSG